MKSNLRRSVGIVLFILGPTTFAAEPSLDERRVVGVDAKLLAEAMAASGGIKEAAPTDRLPGDHPRLSVAKDFVYRFEGVVCREGKKPNCDPFTLSAGEMKKVFNIVKKLGVVVTQPPKKSKEKPFYYVKEIVCGADVAEGSTPICGLTAHFKSKKQ